VGEPGNENEGEYGKRLGPLNDIGNLFGFPGGGVIINRPSNDMVGMESVRGAVNQGGRPGMPKDNHSRPRSAKGLGTTRSEIQHGGHLKSGM
jgi:hypothetical protein